MIKPINHLNLSETAAHYKLDPKTIKATIAMHEDFPCIKTGGYKNGWTLDIDAIDKWLKTNEWYYGPNGKVMTLRRMIAEGKEAPAAVETKPEPEVEENVPAGIKSIRKEQGMRESKSKVQTELLQLELDKKRGLLVDREEVVAVFSYKMARFAKQHELIPNLIGKKMGLSDETIRLLRDHLDEARRALLKDDEGYFAQMAQYGG